MRALNSSGVFDETTEEGRLFQTGIVLGKNEFFRASLSARYLVVSAQSRFGPVSFRPWVVSAWVVSAWVDSALGRFGPVWWVVSAYFFSIIRLVTECQLNTFLASWRVHVSW